ncbi:mannose-1-phosphate guanylyltransferase/mannose-6-phosphate isomerase [Endothiovibrio diazotrophicus]
MILPVILSGGVGSRLWPLSREAYPKQLLALTGERTMIQETAARLHGLAGVERPLVVCNSRHRFVVAEQMEAVGGTRRVLLEPVGRNTAPAVAMAALEAMADGDDPVLLVLPADHLIREGERFLLAVRDAVAHAEAGHLVTFGIVPERPETGYGYIRGGARVEGAEGVAFVVTEFVEKPDLATAERYVAAGDFYWNSGMFAFRASRYLEELERFRPEIAEGCRLAHREARRDADFVRVGEEAFAAVPADSIDYAVMEHTGDAVMVPLDAGWSDVGSWSALWEVGERGEGGNVVKGDVLLHDVRDSFIHAEERMVAAVGLNDHIVVETADVVLVAHRDHAQEVKALVDRLKAENREEAVLHRKVYRPWGCYETIDEESRFKVKRIRVNPGASISLQMHHHRAEHWIVVKGTARIVRGEEVVMLAENQSTYIPVGVRHRLENPGIIPLEIIEVQSGSYLGEDDIVRFEDYYGREGNGDG